MSRLRAFVGQECPTHTARHSSSEAGSLHRNSEVGALEADDPAHLNKTGPHAITNPIAKCVFAISAFEPLPSVSLCALAVLKVGRDNGRATVVVARVQDKTY